MDGVMNLWDKDNDMSSQNSIQNFFQVRAPLKIMRRNKVTKFDEHWTYYRKFTLYFQLL